jgi:hypothetical protein
MTFPDAAQTAADTMAAKVARTLLQAATMLRRLLFSSALALSACASGPPAAETTDAIAAIDPAAYSGVWTPDHAANRKLARAAQKQMRQRMAKMKPPGGDKPPGGGGMPPDGPPGGMGGMGGMGGPPGGMPGMEIDPLAMMSTVGMLRPEMDFAAPLQGDLRIAIDPEAGVEMGAVGALPVTLMFRGGARDLGDDVSAFASRGNATLVIEINTGDGTQVTHTYALEAQGMRMRVKTLVISKKAPIPGGIAFERLYNRRLYNRVDVAPKAAP